jgi:RNA polymerase sigma-70 factor, ECF subfamily
MLSRRQTSDRHREAEQRDTARAIETANPASLLELREERHRVQHALQALSPEHREILVLKYVQGHRYEEIASLLVIARGTVMSRLYHARTALREKYLELDRATDSTSPEKIR